MSVIRNKFTPTTPALASLDMATISLLLSLLDTQSVTQTARHMGLSQPTVSRALSRLRTSLQDPLLVRSGTGLVLTPYGQSLRLPLTRWLAEGHMLLSPQVISAHQIERHFKIASTDFGILSVLAPAIDQITQNAPHIQITVEPLCGESQDRLNKGDLDMVITGFDPDSSQVHSHFLFTEYCQLVARKDHPVFQSDTLKWQDLVEWPLLRINIPNLEADPLSQCLKNKGIALKSLISIDGFSAAPYMLLQSNLIATLPATAAQRFTQDHALRAFLPPEDFPSFGYWLVWHERSHRDLATRWLLRQLKAAF
ncbi:LysR family transcriptional regulator [Woodsholea maritima]|uniref:LysR family transcriptional regulator n=1 Tax=Woodsholea maritima TaxID=240237 RepID=UPI000477FAA2|nr:LysR family transcriptional regulator [Woodsholea maritima]